jgi:branched-chain amino acid transport system permease protein
MKITPRTRAALLALLAVAALTLPLWTSLFTVQLATRGLYLGILAMAFILLAGYGDMMSLALMSFASIAGYVIAIGVMTLNMDHGVLVPLALAGSLVLGAVFGFIAIRAYKIYFLMMTLALSQLFYGVGMQWASVTGGQYGYTGISRPVVFGLSLMEGLPLYYLTLIVTVLSYLGLRRLVRSPFGLALQGIRDNPRRMAALGFNVQLHRYAAIVLTAAISGVAGILTTYFTGVISPARANLPQSVLVVMAALVGGVTTLEGGLLGGLLIAFLISVAGQLTTRYWTFIGLLFILIVMFLPNGLLGRDRRVGDWLRQVLHRPAKTAAPPAQAEGEPALRHRLSR